VVFTERERSPVGGEPYDGEGNVGLRFPLIGERPFFFVSDRHKRGEEVPLKKKEKGSSTFLSRLMGRKEESLHFLSGREVFTFPIRKGEEMVSFGKVRRLILRWAFGQEARTLSPRGEEGKRRSGGRGGALTKGNCWGLEESFIMGSFVAQEEEGLLKQRLTAGERVKTRSGKGVHGFERGNGCPRSASGKRSTLYLHGGEYLPPGRSTGDRRRERKLLS